MNFQTKLQVKFFKHRVPDTLEWDEPMFKDEIDRIYFAYRQCYSRNPFKIKSLSVEESQQLLERYKEYIRTVLVKFHPTFKYRFTETQLTMQNIDEYLEVRRVSLGGLTQFDDYLRKCWFIAQHSMHQSPLEHGGLTVQITGLSRAASMQHNRHRLQSISQASQRYIKEDDPDIVEPASIRRNHQAREIFENYLGQLPEVISRLKECGIPTEDIRAIFPNAMSTSLVVTMNFRAWMHYFEERSCKRAQSEIRHVSDTVLHYLQEEIPFVFAHAGAKCIRLGYCPEAESCGRKPCWDDLIPAKVSS